MFGCGLFRKSQVEHWNETAAERMLEVISINGLNVLWLFCILQEMGSIDAKL